MQEIITKTNNKIKIFTENVDKATIGSLRAIFDLDSMMSKKVRIMPDCHYGRGAVVGTTIAYTNNIIIPNLLGTDIGCGILAVKLKDKRIDLPKFDSVVKKRIPCGKDIYDEPLEDFGLVDNLRYNLHCNFNADRVSRSLGTLGGGNHFIELDKDTQGNIWLLIHTGSRSLGDTVCKCYQQRAYDTRDTELDLPYDFCHISGQDYRNYLNDVERVQKFAWTNRIFILNQLMRYAKIDYEPDVDMIDCPHNYIDGEFNYPILRKGAISAKKDELCVIPLNMAEGALICKGKGNEDWNYSAPHGCGRSMSRNEAISSISMKDYKASMEGIYSTTVNKSTIDESKFAYKPSDEIINSIGDTVEIIDRLTPIYNFKAGRDDE